MSGRAPMMCFNCENKDVGDDEKYHWRIRHWQPDDYAFLSLGRMC